MTHPRALSKLVGLALGAALALAGGPALAQTYTPTATTADLGKVVAANTGATNFAFASSSGSVTPSGGGTRLSTNTVRSQVTIGCTGTASVCAGAIDVKIGSTGTPTGKAGSLSAFNVTAVSGSITNLSAATNPLTFTIKPVNKNTSASFYVGATIPINGNDGSGSPGNAASQFYVYVADTGTTPTTGTTGSVTAVVDRPIAFTSTNTALEFGTIYNPTSGTSTVTLDPNLASNPVSVTGNAIAVPSPTPQRAAYSIQGEGGQTFSVTLSALTLSNGANSIPVTLTTSTPLPTTLSNSAGNLGTASFYVGGSFDITPSTPGQTYTGNFNVTVQYN